MPKYNNFTCKIGDVKRKDASNLDYWKINVLYGCFEDDLKCPEESANFHQNIKKGSKITRGVYRYFIYAVTRYP